MDPKFASFAIYEHCLPFNVSRAYDEAQRHRSSGDLDRGARPRHVGAAARLRRKMLTAVASRAALSSERHAQIPSIATTTAVRRDQEARSPVRHAVVVVGAGPVGLAAAIDLAQRGVPVVLLDDTDRIGEGSRGICWSSARWNLRPARRRRTHGREGRHLEARQGLLRRRPALRFDLLPEDGHKMPAFINLQQFYLEKALVDRAAEIAAHRSALAKQRGRRSNARNDRSRG